jgi:hypothetical protein
MRMRLRRSRSSGSPLAPSRSRAWRRSGQATVEYLIVGVMLMVAIVAAALLWRSLQSGVFVQHAALSASHACGAADLGAVGDVALY